MGEESMACKGKGVWSMVSEPRTGEREAHGRYYAEYVGEVSDEPRDQLQALLDEKDAGSGTPRRPAPLGVLTGLSVGSVLTQREVPRVDRRCGRPQYGRATSCATRAL